MALELFSAFIYNQLEKQGMRHHQAGARDGRAARTVVWDISRMIREIRCY